MVGSILNSRLKQIANLWMKTGARNLFNKGIDIGSRIITSDIGKKLIDEGIKHGPELYKFGTSKIKNQNIKNALESDMEIIF